MCGRFTNTHSNKDVVKRFKVERTLFDITPRYNIAPSQQIPVITQTDEVRCLEGYKWGLVPFWAKDAKIGNKMINARAETLLEKPAFRQALTKRRCLIPADGFYEWQAQGKLKQPIYIRRRDKALFAFAGLWEEWRSPEGELLRSCTIITGTPNELIAPIHDRMAVILTPEHEARWLAAENQDAAELVKLLTPYPAAEMETYPVSRLVNSPAAEQPECVAPLAE
jgi:putative SOS response-associated peptidase YedK